MSTVSDGASVTAAASASLLFENEGYCACCRQQTTFRAEREWLRDGYICVRCHSIPRQRHLATVLDENVASWTTRAVHESSPSNDYVARWCEDYSSSQFLPGVARGEVRDGVRCEDIEALTFPAESFDVFVTQDVLEHVFDPAQAVRDIHRVLRPGGVHVFTTPKYRRCGPSVQRARQGSDGQVEHLLPEEYHGSPVGDGRALVTWDFGDDFDDLLSEWVGVDVTAHHRIDRARGLDAEFLEVWLIRKPGEVEPAAAAPLSGRKTLDVLFDRFAARLPRRHGQDVD